MSRVRLAETCVFILLAWAAKATAQPATSAPSAANPPAPTAPTAPAATTTAPTATASTRTEPPLVAPVAAPATTTAADGVTVTPSWVVQTLLRDNVSLYASRLGIRQAGEAIREEENAFPYIFQADAGYTNSQTPQTAGGRVTTTESNAVVLGAQLSRTFPTGTTASIRTEGQRMYTHRPTATGTTGIADTGSSGGVGYQATVRATVSQPLLSGYGTEVNEAGLRTARISEVRLRKAHAREQSEMVRDALSAYWELWYMGRAIDIQRGALDLAILQQQDADKRVGSGALSPADALKFRSQVATLTESWLGAQSDETAQAVELGRLVGAPDEAEKWHADTADPEPAANLVSGEVLERMLAESPAIADYKEALRLAMERRKTAGESYRSRLDLQTWVEATGVGAGSATPAMRQLRDLDAVSVYGGLTYQTSLGQGRIDAARAQADYDVQIAQANLKAQTQQLKSSAARLLVQSEQARISAEAAQATLDITATQAQNERQRFALGASTPLDVQVAEEALRQARLRVLRAKVDRIKTEIALAHATGELLTRYVQPQGSNP